MSLPPRNVELPAAGDVSGDPSVLVTCRIYLINEENISLSCFYKGCCQTGASLKTFVLTDTAQVIQLIPTDGLFPQSWYLLELFKDDGVQFYRFQVPSYTTGDEDPLTWESLVLIQSGIDAGVIGENRLLPENPSDQDLAVYDADSGMWVPYAFAPGAVGDMHTLVYDPNNKQGDMFLFENLEGTYDCGEV